MSTDAQPLKIGGSDLELRFCPLPALAAIDEFLGLGKKLDESGALTLIMVSGTGMQLSPGSWDAAEFALVLKALVAASGEGKASDAFVGVCKRYTVSVRRAGEWEPVDTERELNKLGPDAIFVVFACLKASFTPFLDRLKSSAVETAEQQAQRSPTSVETG